MTRFPIACAVLALSLAAPVFAQTTAPGSTPGTAPNNPGTTMPSNQPMGSTQSQMNSPSQSNATAADLSGQAIYSAKGKKIGTVSSMSTDAKGQQAASVTMDQYLGMGGQTILVPVSSLQARANGGYTTTLSNNELKALSKSSTGSMQ